MKKKLIISVVVLALLAGIAVTVWEFSDWPPPRLILKYGLPPAGRLTGRQQSIMGIDFVEIAPGYFWRDPQFRSEGDLLGMICRPLGIPVGRPRVSFSDSPPGRWVEIAGALWIARARLSDLPIGAIPEAARSRIPVAVSICRWLADNAPGRYRLPYADELHYAQVRDAIDFDRLSVELCISDEESLLPTLALGVHPIDIWSPIELFWGSGYRIVWIPERIRDRSSVGH